jgi:hypothetical protein
MSKAALVHLLAPSDEQIDRIPRRDNRLVRTAASFADSACIFAGKINPGKVIDLVLPLDHVAEGLSGDGRAPCGQDAAPPIPIKCSTPAVSVRWRYSVGRDNRAS